MHGDLPAGRRLMLRTRFERRLARLRLTAAAPRRGPVVCTAPSSSGPVGRAAHERGRQRGGGKEPNETNHNHFLSLDAVSWI